MGNILSTIAAAGLASIIFSGIANAQTIQSAGSGTADWMSISQIIKKIEGNGYKVREVEMDDGLYEISAVDANGMRVQADFNPATGEPVRGWRYDD
jgi:hypothetical protein